MVSLGDNLILNKKRSINMIDKKVWFPPVLKNETPPDVESGKPPTAPSESFPGGTAS